MKRGTPPVRVVPSSTQPGVNEVTNVAGNFYDKHGSSNPIVKRLMARFHTDVTTALQDLPHGSVLDVGCGEGVSTRALAKRLESHFVGVDLELPVLHHAKESVPDGLVCAASIYELPFPSGSFDTCLATEVLEHLDDPARALHELARVARFGLVVTVPREPWWRLGNMLRGAYLGSWGNTPGHIQHWSYRSFTRFLTAEFDEVEATTSAMWNLGVIRL